MIIDTHLHPTNKVDEAWRHTGEPFTGERLLEMMDGPFIINGKPRRIDMGFIQPPPGNTCGATVTARGGRASGTTWRTSRTSSRRIPDRFIGDFTYNPRFGPENAAAELEFHVKEYGYKMMKLHANMHAYRPDRALDWLRPALRKCDELGIVVLLHTGDGPYSIPTQFYPIIREFKNVNFIIGHFGVQTGGVYCFEALWMILDSPNVYGESGWLLQSRIVEFAKEMPDRPPRVRHRLAAERAGHVAAPARGAVHAAAAGPQLQRGGAGGLHGQQRGQARRDRGHAAAGHRRGGGVPPGGRFGRSRFSVTGPRRLVVGISGSSAPHYGIALLARAAGSSRTSRPTS